MSLFIPPHVATRDLSRVVLAQDLTAGIADAACAGMAAQWSIWEHAYKQARTPAQRSAALADPGTICATCTAHDDCADLAELTRYTGIAAGHPYNNGHRLDLRGRRSGSPG
ncbi:hypothetical protein [Ornithinimicrobium cavernae]|uniref:hypothetical protein n=1 Tax=Ornithinimicrobium cavernae TaxID=2666047 RepID=UPI0012B16358|nr:hypothetical protein [Ornithinimicrobium cavernae]